MSRLKQDNGDDYPEAARKHLLDAAALLSAGRPDGSAYLAGYVVECSLKTLLQIEKGSADRIHMLAALRRQVAALAVQANVTTGRYCLVADRLLRNAVILKWRPEIRYREPSTSAADAQAWQREAAAVYSRVVGALILDGRI